MKVNVLEEMGYAWAVRGMSYSHMLSTHDPDVVFAAEEKVGRAKLRADKLAHKDGGHNKFLESTTVWMDVKATRAWWSQFDTYRIGITKLSTSTMHTLMKLRPSYEDFHPHTPMRAVKTFLEIYDLEMSRDKPRIDVLKYSLPEGYLQLRLVCTNYKALRNVHHQRSAHRLPDWASFIAQVTEQLEHPHFITER